MSQSKAAAPSRSAARVVASFRTSEDCARARRDLDRRGFTQLRSLSPIPLEEDPDGAPEPIAALVGGVVCFCVAFLIEVYANAVSYPLDIGGRPRFSWPSFIPIAFEVGALGALVSALACSSVGARLFHFYDEIDEADSAPRRLCDLWTLAALAPPSLSRDEIGAVLAPLEPVSVDFVA